MAIGGDRFSKNVNYSTGTARRTPSQIRNQQGTNRYKLNDYSADKRFGQQGMAYGQGNKKGGFGFPLGGFGGGGRGGAAFAEEDLARQLEYDKAVWERSTPNVSGVGGSVNWNRDTNTVESSLSDENQSIYDSMFARQGMFGGQADAMANGGWRQMQQERFDQKRGLYAEGDALADQRRREQEQNTGASTTAKYYGSRAGQDAINQRDMQLEEQAFLESQGLLDSNLNRQSQAVGMMADLGGIANNMIQYPTPNTDGNMQNVSLASTRWADNLAMENAKKAKGKSDFWGSLASSIFA